MLWASVVGAYLNTFVGAYKKRWRVRPRAGLTHPPTPTRAGPGQTNSAALHCPAPTLPCPPKPCGRNGCCGWRIQKAVARQAARWSHPPTDPHQGRPGADQLRCAPLPCPDPALSAQALRSEWLLRLAHTKSGGAASRALVRPHPCPLSCQAARQEAASSHLPTYLPAKPKSGGAASRALVRPHPCPLCCQAVRQVAASSPLPTCLPAKPKIGGAASRALVFPHPCPLCCQAVRQVAASSPLPTCLPAKPKIGGAASRALIYFL